MTPIAVIVCSDRQPKDISSRKEQYTSIKRGSEQKVETKTVKYQIIIHTLKSIG